MAKDDQDFTEIASGQYDVLYDGPDRELAEAIWLTYEAVLNSPETARAASAAIRKQDGSIVMRLPVIGHPHSVFWTTGGPRIEAIFPYP